MLLGMAISSLAVGRWGEALGRRRTYVGLLRHHGRGRSRLRADRIRAAPRPRRADRHPLDRPERVGTDHDRGAVDAASRRRPSEAASTAATTRSPTLPARSGALAAGGPSALRDVVPGLPPDQRWLLLMPIGAAVCVLLAARLTGHVEVGRDCRHAPAACSDRSSVVRRLAALFALDAFAGGFIVQSFLVFWFGRQFGADAELMGLVFFGVGLLQAASSVAAGWLAARIGLLNTMVFTHLPSNVLLALIPFAPTLEVAVAAAARALRALPDGRSGPPGVRGGARRPGRADGGGGLHERRAARRAARRPDLASASMGMAAGLPFLIAGGLKAVYDVALYFTFRRVRLADDDPAPTRPA